MKQQRNLREILLLPELERERSPRKNSAAMRRKSILAAFAFFFLIVVVIPLVYFITQKVEVPDLNGLPLETAKVRLARVDLKARVVEERFSTSPKGEVLDQNPRPGKVYRGDGSVSIVVSAGTEEIVLPKLSGENEVYASSHLLQLGLVPLIIEEVSTQTPGIVISMNPSAGDIVKTGDTIKIVISAKQELVPLREIDLKDRRVALLALSHEYDDKLYAQDVALRSAALLKAAGAEVTIYSQEAQLNAQTQANAFVRIESRGAETANGLLVIGEPDKALEPSMAGLMYSELKDSIQNIRRDSAVVSQLNSAERLQAAISLGNLVSPSDASLLEESSYRDLIARGIYLGIAHALSP